MIRPIEYDKDEVLKAATELFWKKGYELVSMNELVEVTGLNKHSMYDIFGNKSGLFSAALKHYCDSAPDEIKQLSNKPYGIDSIEKYLRFLAEYAGSEDCIGCLVINTIVENEQVDDGVVKVAEEHIHEMRKDIEKNLKSAQNQKNISSDKNCRDLANYIICFIQGMMVSGKMETCADNMNKLVDTVISTLRR